MVSPTSRGLYGRLVQELGTSIVNGTIAPGERLDVDGLEHRHGVSRTVVREAVRVLATKGLVDARPRRGTYVLEPREWNMLDPDIISWRFDPRPDAKFLRSLEEVRQIIEPAAARLAAKRRTKQDLAAMREALDEMADSADDIDAAVAADLAFHRNLFAATHNEMLEHIEMLLLAGLRARDTMAMQARFDADVPHHAAVLKAVSKGSGGAAETAMHQLLEQAAAHVREALSES
jgi:GntR family transcriptional regulator, galactonate operon transcriptional repressor